VTEPKADAGLSLVELVVAILILSIAIVGAFRVLDMGVRQAGDERSRVLASLVLLNRAAELRLGESDLPGEVDMGGRRWSVSSVEAATEGGFVKTTLTATQSDGGPGARIVVWLDPDTAR
jgi:general secretion pathway protein I